ncbi:uracil-DNA glycosylase-like protein [Cristinia sonorae]|uniref:Uracil-DNA glycosylase-like protein n=1 Tax=Cristinia sonorae TaxID=1940300 RepID=A0A8K0URV0_9AGAR|nr:uracil-DNA glycosylase-like protein [Cristinia sonorae]
MSTPMKTETPLSKLKETLEVFRFESPAQQRLCRSSRKRTDSNLKRGQDEDGDVLPNLGGVEQDKETTAGILSASTSLPKPSWKRTVPIVKVEGPSNTKKLKRGFAPPEQYAHLGFLSDYLKDSLDVMFCGVNPGCKSAEVGHHFANPTNHFWKCLHQSGMPNRAIASATIHEKLPSELTERLLPPSEDHTLPGLYNLGLTNLVARPSAEQAELSKDDMIQGVPVLLQKIAEHRPRVVCFVGKGIWDVFAKEAIKLSLDGHVLRTNAPSGFSFPLPVNGQAVKTGNDDPSALAVPSKRGKQPIRPRKVKIIFGWGLQPIKVVHPVTKHDIAETMFFVMPSTSGRVVSHQLPDKVKLFATLREDVVRLKAGEIETKNMAVIYPPTMTPFDDP